MDLKIQKCLTVLKWSSFNSSVMTVSLFYTIQDELVSVIMAKLEMKMMEPAVKHISKILQRHGPVFPLLLPGSTFLTREIKFWMMTKKIANEIY